MKISNQINFYQIKNNFLRKENISRNNAHKVSDENYKAYSASLTSYFKGLISFEGKKIAEPNKERIIELFNEGTSEEEIAKIIGCNPQTITKALINWGVRQKYFTAIQRDRQKIMRLVDENKSIKEISEITGYSRDTISRALAKWGVPHKNIDNRKEEIIELHNENKTRCEIADITNYSVKTINNAMQKWGVRSNSAIEPKKDEIIRMYNEGLSQAEIAKIMNFHQTSIGDALKRWGIETRQNKNILEDKKDEIIYLYEQEGKNQREIADIYGCTVDTVHKHLIKWGVKMRDLHVLEAKKDRIIELYNEGKTLDEISEEIDSNSSTIRTVLIRWGIIEDNRKPRTLNKPELCKDEIIRLYKEGKTQKEIAELLGCTQPAVSKALSLWGMRRKNRRSECISITEKNKDLIIELYKNGKNTVEIGKIIGCHYTVISFALKKWGIRLYPNTNADRDELIAELKKSGKTIREMASIVGCSTSTIVKTLRKLGKNENSIE